VGSYVDNRRREGTENLKLNINRLGIKILIPYICVIKIFNFMAKNKQIEVSGILISVKEKNQDDFISLTYIASGFEGGNALIEKWIRNKNTIEFLALWERLNNQSFNSPEFEGIRKEAGTNRFIISVKQWIQKTNAIGVIASAGRYGGTYAHRDIAIEFCAWLSPEFKLLVIKEIQRLKLKEESEKNEEWSLNRLLSKVNYKIHTDSIKDLLIPSMNINKEKEWLVYADEADLLNLALFGMTAKEWKTKNPDAVLNGMNIRDLANLHQLTVLSNLESYNAILISQGKSKEERLVELRKTAITQLQSLQSSTSYTIDKLKSPNLKLLNNKKDSENQ
jgi:hypothetical protein